MIRYQIHPGRKACAWFVPSTSPGLQTSRHTLRHLYRRRYAVQAQSGTIDSSSGHSSHATISNARYNEIGVQQLSAPVHAQIFGKTPIPPPKELVELSKNHLARHELWGKTVDTSPPVIFDLPKLQGQTLDEHFHRLGMDAAEPYLTLAKDYARTILPDPPRKWVRQSGWTKYYPDGRTEAVDAPQESVLTFDTEVMWKESPFAVMATAVSPTAWYAWLSPWLLGESTSDRHLVPLGDPSVPRIVLGHNIGYDRARIADEYNINGTKTYFMDTMSLHVAVNGMCSRQRPTWMRHRKNQEMRDKIVSETASGGLAALLDSRLLVEEEQELWVGRSSVNSLRDVAKFHCNVTIDKSQRDQFGEFDREGIRRNLDELLDYCAADTAITHRVFKKVFPNFLDVCPHPVSFAALRHLSSVILPVNKSWNSYIHNAEATYHRLSDAVQQRLLALTDRALESRHDPSIYSNDPWLRQLDWTGQEMKMVKGKKKGDPPRPAVRQKKPGMPKWYKDLFTKNDAPINLTVRTRIAPILLRLAWDGYPLIWSDKYGWTFRVPIIEAAKYNNKPVVRCDMLEEKNLVLRDDHQGIYFKLPHKDGPAARCANPLAKGYMQYFENGTLSSEYAYAKEALEMNASCSYWISARDRIMGQLVVYKADVENEASQDARAADEGFILPQVIPMGTITRRAVENTWLTASNAKKNRVGSELKAMVQAPPGYCFVGADVDSEELWIASLVGDAQFRLHGGNAIGFMTLEGTKAEGTDLHSKTAKILGISRNDAKVFNYGRIYGAGARFAANLLRQFNPGLSEAESTAIAENLYKETKGKKTTRKILCDRPFWRGGTESLVFNKLEEFAEQERPRTPVLGAGITEALMRRYINKGGFMTSRINWAIQSSGVDYLHLLIISMDYLIRRFDLEARLAITVHDEIRYLVKEDHKYKAAMALQIANIWTRAMFSQQMGINDLPQSCAFFSAVDIDHVLRKEVDMDCITPSHPTSIPHGESLSIQQLLEKGELSRLDPSVRPRRNLLPRPEKWEYTPRQCVMESLSTSSSSSSSSSGDLNFLKAQITSSDNELRDILKGERKTTTTKTTTTGVRNYTSTMTPRDGGAGGSNIRRQRKPPAHVQPQAVDLPDIGTMIRQRLRTGPGSGPTGNGENRWLFDHRQAAATAAGMRHSRP